MRNSTQKTLHKSTQEFLEAGNLEAVKNITVLLKASEDLYTLAQLLKYDKTTNDTIIKIIHIQQDLRKIYPEARTLELLK